MRLSIGARATRGSSPWHSSHGVGQMNPRIDHVSVNVWTARMSCFRGGWDGGEGGDGGERRRVVLDLDLDSNAVTLPSVRNASKSWVLG